MKTLRGAYWLTIFFSFLFVVAASAADTTPPVLSGCPEQADYECCSEVPPPPPVTAIDDVDPAPMVIYAEVKTAGSCPQNYTLVRAWFATDASGNQASCSQIITVKDTTPPTISCAGPDTIEYPDPVLFSVPEVSDLCDPSPMVTFIDASSPGTCPQEYSVTRKWWATDACGNMAVCSQTITVVDTTPPVITCPKDYYANCASGKCSTDPEVTGQATATDNCSDVVTVTYQDSGTPDPMSCQWTITRTWTATDACGNEATCYQSITCVPFSQTIVTDSGLCSDDLNPSTQCRDFRLLFTPYGNGYKLNASNPGQTYYNVFYVGTPGASVTFDITLPYPYVTQGADPVHAYDGVTIAGTNPTYCLTPGSPVPIESVAPLPVTLTSYSPQACGSVTTVAVTMEVPDSGFIYLNIHVDYGLKGMVGLTKGGPSGNDAVSQNTGLVVPDGYRYLFSVSGDQTDMDGVCNMNVFKKNPGVGGR